MSQKVKIKILKFQYGGDSIGNDIRLEINTFGQLFSLDQTIKPKTITDINQEISQLSIGGDILEVPINIRVIEKDLIFNDVGEINDVIRIDPLVIDPQTFDFQVKVQEKNKVVGKSTAIFSLSFGIEIFNPDNIELKSYNNDGWIDPKTKQVAREYEWAPELYGEKVLDYGGDAKVVTHQDSLKWGIRWLYHKAQEIKDGKRNWHNWKEAVKGYGPGKRGYEEKVWNIYTKGIDTRGKAKVILWSIALSLMLIPVLGFGGWLAVHQGKIYISFNDAPQIVPKDDGNYQVRAKIVNGLGIQDLLLANVYSNGLNSLALDRNIPIYTKYIDIDNDKKEEIVVTGYYLGGTRKYLLKKENDVYVVIHNITETNSDKEAFWSDQISFMDVDGNRDLEAVTDSLIEYDGIPDQVWTSYYRLVGDHYQFYKKDKVNFSDFKRLLVMAPDYYANNRK